MFRDYMLVSPSLDGILRHESLAYGDLRRPPEVARVCDHVSGKEPVVPTEHELRVLEEYFHDLYGVFMKKLSFFVVETEPDSEETLKLQAMLQEMLKIKKLMSKRVIAESTAETPPEKVIE